MSKFAGAESGGGEWLTQELKKTVRKITESLFIFILLPIE